VLHVVTSTDRRGAETFAVDLDEALRAQGVSGEVVALAPGPAGGLDLPTLGPRRFAPVTLAALRRRARAVETVVAHGSSTLPAVATAVAGTGVPFVYRSIGDPLAWVTSPARRARVRLAAGRARAVVALWPGSAVVWHEHLGVDADRIVVIPNAVKAGDFHPVTDAERRAARARLGIPPDGPLVACLGALSPEKRVDLAIDAVAALDGVRLAVVGDGPSREAVIAAASRCGQGRVHVLGSHPRPQPILAAADLVTIPSDTEGQPAVAIQAGLSGLAVVATDVGGLAEIVDHGRTGLLVRRGDRRALSAAMARALEAETSLGAAARRRNMERFALDAVVPAWRELLEGAAGRTAH
jgi:glycosyltransferase involved in cell wall biosynthesis